MPLSVRRRKTPVLFWLVDINLDFQIWAHYECSHTLRVLFTIVSNEELFSRGFLIEIQEFPILILYYSFHQRPFLSLLLRSRASPAYPFLHL